MIHLDTNYLIRVLVKGSLEAGHVDAWLSAGESFSASAIAWTEFLSGPITPAEVTNAESLIVAAVLVSIASLPPLPLSRKHNSQL